MSPKRSFTDIDSRYWELYVYDFLYSGLIRGFLPSSLSNLLFFPRFLLITFLLVRYIRTNRTFDAKDRFFISLSVLLLVWQLLHFSGGYIDFKTCIYGIYLYVIPIIGFALSRRTMDFRIKAKLHRIFLLSLPVQVSLVISQVVLKLDFLYSAGFGEGLYSSGNVQRATGSFSSAAGFAIYVSLMLIVLVDDDESIIRPHSRFIYINWMMLFILVLLSGSRTILLNLVFCISILIVVLPFRRRALQNTGVPLFRIILSCTVLAILFWSIAKDAITAFQQRWVSGNSVDNPFDRLVLILNLNTKQAHTFFGEGFASRALGSVRGATNAETFTRWIEYDFQRILVESGLLIFFIIVLLRLYLIIYTLRVFVRSPGLATRSSIFLASLFPWIIFGQMFGQGSVSGGTWLGLYMAANYREKEGRQVV